MVVLELAVQLDQSRRGAVQAAARQDVRKRAVGGFCARPRILRDVAKCAAAQHEAGRGVVLAGQHLEQARLARAIAADEPDLVPGVDSEAGVGEHAARRDVDGESSGLQHGVSNCYVLTPARRLV